MTLPGFVTQSLSGFQMFTFEIFETNHGESKELSTVTVVSPSYEDVLLYVSWLNNGDPTGIRTRDTTVKGWCLNHLTIGPCQLYKSLRP